MQIEVITTGTKYYDGLKAIDVNSKVDVRFDASNLYSNNAFSVSTLGGLRIGSVAENPSYIPRKIVSETTILAKELKQLVNDGFTIVGAVVKEIVRNYQFPAIKGAVL